MILVVGAGGNGQTYFMDFLIKNKVSINNPSDEDGLKHIPSPLSIPNNINIEKCIFLYNHPYYCLLSHYRRKWPMFQCIKLGNPYKLTYNQIKNYNSFKKLTLLNNKDLYGIEYQFNNWITQKTSFPILFLNFNEIIAQKEVLDNFLEIPEYIELAKSLGFDGIKLNIVWNWNTWSAVEFQMLNIADTNHPRHSELVEILSKYKNDAQVAQHII